MAERNQLFFIILTSVFIAGCGTLPLARGRCPKARASREHGRDGPAVPAPSETAGTPARDTDMLFHALAAAGADYRRGGKSYQSGFDCSGLVAFVYREATVWRCR
jgi:cell wall-associated NlpC family hydrolase